MNVVILIQPLVVPILTVHFQEPVNVPIFLNAQNTTDLTSIPKSVNMSLNAVLVKCMTGMLKAVSLIRITVTRMLLPR